MLCLVLVTFLKFYAISNPITSIEVKVRTLKFYIKVFGLCFYNFISPEAY